MRMKSLAAAGLLAGSALVLTACGDLPFDLDFGPRNQAVEKYDVKDAVTTLHVESGSGDVVVNESDRTGIAVTETLHYRGDKPTDGHKVGDGTLNLAYACNDCSIDYNVEVPEGPERQGRDGLRGDHAARPQRPGRRLDRFGRGRRQRPAGQDLRRRRPARATSRPSSAPRPTRSPSRPARATASHGSPVAPTTPPSTPARASRPWRSPTTRPPPRRSSSRPVPATARSSSSDRGSRVHRTGWLLRKVPGWMTGVAAG